MERMRDGGGWKPLYGIKRTGTLPDYEIDERTKNKEQGRRGKNDKEGKRHKKAIRAVLVSLLARGWIVGVSYIS